MLKNDNLHIKLLKIGILLILSFITISTVSATEIIDNSTDLKQTIIDANNGSTINLDNGIYTNNVINIIIDKNLTIQGKDSKNTIIDAQKLGKIFFVKEGNTLKLINVTLINGNANSGGDITNNHGGCIFNYGTLEIDNCIFENNSATGGGAIASFNGNLNINNSIFTNNSATYGGAVYSKYSNNVNLFNSNFNNNSASYGGGGAINVDCAGDITIINSKFINNSGLTAGGGAIKNNLCRNMTISNSTFIDNIDSYEGGGAIFNSGSNITIENSNFTNNKAENGDSNMGGGGAIYNNGYMAIINSNFINNTAEKDGGAIHNKFTENVIIINSTFINNKAINGGGIFSNGSINMTILNSAFINNIAENNGSAIYNTEYAFSDEWFPEFSMIYNSSMHIKNSNFTNNNRSNIYNTGNITINNSNFTKNDLAIYTEKNTNISSSSIFNNYQGISINSGAENIQINYNRIFNNTNTTNYNLNTNSPNINIDYNWWGSNFNPNSKISGTIVNNYYTIIFEEIKAKNFSILGNLTFKSIVVLNSTFNTFGSENLPDMNIDVYNNNIFISEYSINDLINLNIPIGENNILFVLDNENYKYLIINNNITDKSNSNNPTDPINTTKSNITANNPNENIGYNNNLNSSNENKDYYKKTIAAAKMKKTGLPIIVIFLILLSSLGLIFWKK
ncbi:hypothetical protein [Methanobrevibacter sp.]|uniref:hypothetical protein n=1 Tax=Methanobrevibacter sp. TaxID=66852 RepID=UPI0026389CBC|nr:hypothetical protein [uncultured Methanobrevibacter sp.]